ncbi:MAG TPA: cupin domain-containing protein [Chloroflexota bacterium]|nr:cupin domain-containing protein [Chloroflexota bacterium]
MATKIKELVTRTFMGDRSGHDGERPPMVEIDEEADVLGCQERFERAATHVKPLKILKVDLPGDSATRRIPVLVNDDVRIELATTGAAAETSYAPAGGWYETHIQVEGTSTSRTVAGEYAMTPSNLLVAPPGASHHSTNDGPMSRLIVSTRRPLKVAAGYPLRESAATGDQGAGEPCLYLRPGVAAESAEEGVSGGKHFELVVNDDLMIETTFRADDQRIYHRGYAQDEVHFQLTGRRATRTAQGEFVLETGDMLLIPPGVTHRNIGGMPTIRIVLYTRNPLRVADEYQARLGSAWGN